MQSSSGLPTTPFFAGNRQAIDRLQSAAVQRPRYRAAGICLITLCGFAIILGSRRWLPSDVGASGQAAWGAVSGWLCGIPGGVVVTALAACGDFLSQPLQDVSTVIGFILRWSMTLLLAFWMAELRSRLQTEYQRARLDSLTGLPNRQAFFERLVAEISRANRFQRPLTVTLLDGDNFKAVNDQHGHAQGDWALQKTAHTLTHSVRPYDLVSRLGGDEFALLFPETIAADAERIALRLQSALAEAFQTDDIPLTFSIGVATIVPPIFHAPGRCLAEADRLLYLAKQAGKQSVRTSILASENSAAVTDPGVDSSV